MGWFSRKKNNASDGDDPRSLFEQASTMLSPEPGPSWYEKTVLNLMRRSALLGYAPAQHHLGVLAEMGLGVPQSYSEALRWYTLAAEQRFAPAQNNLGVLHENGSGVTQNYSEAFRWYKLAAEQGHDWAQFRLGFLYDQGLGVQQSKPDGFHWCKLSAEKGNVWAQNTLANLYEAGTGVTQNYSEAFRWYKLAADKGVAVAQHNLGIIYYGGRGVPQNDANAFWYIKLAADQGYAPAQFNVGAMYNNGRGVNKNRSEALRWLKLAAAQGYEDAFRAIDKLKRYAPECHQSQTEFITAPPCQDNVPQSSVTALQDLLDQLNAMTGLANVKSEIYQLVQYARVQKMRSGHGLRSDDISLHSVFTGSPGTGKTTVARLYGQMLKELGFLSTGHLVETDRTGLVAGYVGQTELKTDEKISEALGGILFIDEAYSLFKGGDSHGDFGPEVISVLLKRMEDHRDNFVVIVAGYPEPMQRLLNSNEGLRSRFSTYIHFNDYAPDELLSILQSFCNKGNYSLTPEAISKAKSVIAAAYLNRDQRFGNARYVRNLFESIRKNQSVRIAERFSNPTIQQLTEIWPDDMPS